MDEFLLVKQMLFHSLLLNRENDNISHELIIKRKTVKVLTYNLFLRPPPIKSNENDWKDERLVDFIQEIDNYDIICLQEVFEMLSNRKHELIRLANKAGFFFYCSSPIPNIFSKYTIDGGLLILSRFPIIEHHFVPFKCGVLSDSVAWKGLLMAHIKIMDCSIVIINVHTQASYFYSSQSHWDISSDNRINQLKQIRDYVKFIKEKNDYFTIPSQASVYLCGDFNIDANNYESIKKSSFNHKTVDEYRILEELLDGLGQVRNVYLYQNNSHPVTFGDIDTVLTEPYDVGSKLSLDYLIEIKNKNDSNDDDYVINCLYDTVKVEKFMIKRRPYIQLSDHYGLSVELELISNK